MVDELCVHIKSMFGGIIRDRTLRRFIGKITTFDFPNFLAYCGEIRAVIHAFIQGQCPDDTNNAFIFIKAASGLKTPGGKSFPLTTDEFLNEVFVKFHDNMEKGDRLLASIMKLKTGRQCPGVSRQDLQLIRKSIVESPNVNPAALDYIKGQVRPFIKRFLAQNPGIRLLHREYNPVIAEYSNPLKRSFVNLDEIDLLKSRANPVVYNLLPFMRDPQIFELCNEYPDETIASVFVGADVKNGRFLDLIEPANCSYNVGSIRIINEPGGKHRVVAIPNLFLKCASTPLGRVLTRMNSAWRIQGVDSHENAVKLVQSWLGHGNMVYSIDMKNFTDRLPYEVQKWILDCLLEEGVITPFDCKIFDRICTGTYRFGREIVQYGAGTPQGTEPSFPLASFTNGFIASVAYQAVTDIPWRKLNLHKVPTIVIGDDISFNHSRTAKTYSVFMSDLGVEESHDKTIVSSEYAELCSKLISPRAICYQHKIMRREDKYPLPAQTIASKMDYYMSIDMETLTRFVAFYGLHQVTVDTILMTPQEVGGLGKPLKKILDEILRKDDIYALEAIPLINRISSALRDEESVSKESIQILGSRKDLFPKMEYEVIPTEREVPLRDMTPLIQSLELDFKALARRLERSYGSPNELILSSHKEEITQSIHALQRANVDVRKCLEYRFDSISSNIAGLSRQKRVQSNIMDRWINRSEGAKASLDSSNRNKSFRRR